MAEHRELPIADAHFPYRWEYANAAARTGATGFDAAEVGLFARQLDDNSIWMLTDTTPTWQAVGAGAATTSTPGIVQLATVAEAGTGTNATKAVTPAGLFPAEVTVASGATTNIGAAASKAVQITGTTTITAFDTVAAGIVRFGRFAGALTLTHNGTSLILPGGANITTAANDRFAALSLGSGNWIVLWYQKADGTAVVALALATVAEAGTGTNTTKAVTPAGLFPAEADVASGATTNIGAAATDKVRVTGTTTITAFDTVAAGIKRYGRFSGALTLTHNASSLILPGGANITTAAGDTFLAISLGSGNWIVSSYQKANGTPIVAGAAGTKTFSRFMVLDNQPPSGNYATVDSRNSVLVLNFDPALDEAAIAMDWVPEGVDLSGGITVRIAWTGATATAGDVVWGVSFEKCTTDIDADSWGTEKTVVSTAPGTSGEPKVASVTLTQAEADGIDGGDLFRIRVRRLGASDPSDTMSGDAQFFGADSRKT